MILADRSSSSLSISLKDSVNSNSLSHSTFNKQSLSLLPSNCCHQYCTHLLSSTVTCNSSSLVQQTNGQQYLLSKLTSCNNSLINDESQTDRPVSNTDKIDCITKSKCMITTNEGFRRKKSASLNSPANSGNKRRFYCSKCVCKILIENRPTADELERLELPWCWKSYSVSSN